RTILEALAEDDLLVLGSSNAARDLDRAGLAGHRLLVTGNRGLAGIDGMTATAVGIALNHQPHGQPSAAGQPAPTEPAGQPAPTEPAGQPAPTEPAGRTVALMGDLTFLHDVNGLLIGPGEPRPDLTVVVVNDDGGGIFGTLEYGAPERLATVSGPA